MKMSFNTPTSWQKANRTPPSKPLASDDERDAPAGRIGKRPSAPLRQAHDDLQRGMADTGRAPEAERVYRKLKQPAGR